MLLLSFMFLVKRNRNGSFYAEEEILRTRLRELMRYKSLGLKTFDECLDYEKNELPATRKRSASVSEAGPSGRSAKNSRVLASASKAEQQPASSPQYGSPKFRKASCVWLFSRTLFPIRQGL